MTTYYLDLEYDAPPLRENDRYHWRKKAELTKEIRTTAFRLGRRIPKVRRAEIKLVWVVPDYNRRRDAAAPNPTLKAAIDGLVDAGVLADDHHRIVPRAWCEIEQGLTKGLRLEIREIGDDE